ncbi:6-pyruvoyl tetrahydrobiopterin synthase-like [Oppia nitens]|uniref:6-pyruvoyl tetrahydrobiopterin synthase-like n=1 Tax=Oppia nitens TaxID=1686743 RepID=UPI0023DBD399|nr:6-pyruvoyl tetrahydrobiopterin synthase-like [Oppia nitens]
MSVSTTKPIQPVVYLTRIESFSTAHRMNSPLLDQQTNKQTFGKCNAIHGHNYKIELTVKGTVDPITGFLVDIAVLKKIIDETIMKPFDHKFIDTDVPYFLDNNIVSTAENIVVYIWIEVSKRLPTNVELHTIKLHETDRNLVTFSGEFL